MDAENDSHQVFAVIYQPADCQKVFSHWWQEDKSPEGTTDKEREKVNVKPLYFFTHMSHITYIVSWKHWVLNASILQKEQKPVKRVTVHFRSPQHEVQFIRRGEQRVKTVVRLRGCLELGSETLHFWKHSLPHKLRGEEFEGLKPGTEDAIKCITGNIKSQFLELDSYSQLKVRTSTSFTRPPCFWTCSTKSLQRPFKSI